MKMDLTATILLVLTVVTCTIKDASAVAVMDGLESVIGEDCG